jgi:hypothetical protein
MIDNKDSDNLNESLGELKSFITDNQAFLKKENVDIDNLVNIFDEIRKVQDEIQKLNKKLYDSTSQTHKS